MKICNRQHNQYVKLKTILKNNLIALLDETSPNVKELLNSPERKNNGHKKWGGDLKFWHCECVCNTSQRQFKKHEHWCKRNGYHYDTDKAADIYASACENIGPIPAMKVTKVIVTQAIIQLQSVEETQAALKQKL